MPWLLTSGHPTANQPDGHGHEQHRKREQPAALDPLERPEVAGRLVVGPLRVAVLDETRRWAKAASYPYAAARSRNEIGWTELREQADTGSATERDFPALGPPLARDPRGTRQVRPFATSGVR